MRPDREKTGEGHGVEPHVMQNRAKPCKLFVSCKKNVQFHMSCKNQGGAAGEASMPGKRRAILLQRGNKSQPWSNFESNRGGSSMQGIPAFPVSLSLEGVSQMACILPERLQRSSVQHLTSSCEDSKSKTLRAGVRLQNRDS